MLGCFVFTFIIVKRKSHHQNIYPRTDRPELVPAETGKPRL
jgi:hypothetical protein